MDSFKLSTQFIPSGDQPEAIEKLTSGLNNGINEQILYGVTGSGKTFTMANIIANINRPALVLAHNKTLAAQLCSEFKVLFPYNAVEYFVSYYDYYQPESYIPNTDSYIEKDCSINDEIERLRHSATSSLLERRDVIVVSSVSCIYGLGDPDEYMSLMLSIRQGQKVEFDAVLRKLTEIRYERNDFVLKRNCFRVKGDVIDIFPSYYSDKIVRIEFWDDTVEQISELNALTMNKLCVLSHIAIYPASHYVASKSKMDRAINEIRSECEQCVSDFTAAGKLIEAQRINQRTQYDIEMITELGYCTGIENYSRIISGRPAGSPPKTLIDYFPDDFVLFIDESHVTLPQVRAMYNGDRARKENLVNYGFRLPSAFDNRPLKFDEFYNRIHQVIYVSATPGDFELARSGQIAEQLIRPTGLLDPIIEVRPTRNQIDDVIEEIHKRIESGHRTLVTALTKKMAENLSEYLIQAGIKSGYLHSDVSAIDRMEIIRKLRTGEYDVLVGINLLREGLDLPEVSLVIILDADKEGFLRSDTSLIQTVGRAARNSEGTVIFYADEVTAAMKKCIEETARRRSVQLSYNNLHNIIPKTIIKDVRDILEISSPADKQYKGGRNPIISAADKDKRIADLEQKMKKASQMLEYEIAAELRDEIIRLRGE